LGDGGAGRDGERGVEGKGWEGNGVDADGARTLKGGGAIPCARGVVGIGGAGEWGREEGGGMEMERWKWREGRGPKHQRQTEPAP